MTASTPSRDDAQARRDLRDIIALCKAEGYDPYPWIADTLRELGYTVIPPNVGGMGREQRQRQIGAELHEGRDA